MTNALIPAKAATLPGIVAEDEAADELVAGFISTINTERGFDALPRLPTEEERAVMLKRIARLALKTRPISYAAAWGTDLMASLGQLWLRYPSLRNHDCRAMGAAYSEDLQSYPLFAVKAALEDVCKGRIQSLDPEWPPTSVRIVKVAADYAAEENAKLLRAERVIKINKVALPDNAAIGAKLAESVQDFIKRRRDEQKEADAIERADACQHMAATAERMQRAEYAAMGVEPIKFGGITISPTLARKLGAKLAKDTVSHD